jgi:transcriptional regulator with XRE-family HTH domain
MIKQSARAATLGKRIAMIREQRLMSQAALSAAIGASKYAVFHLEQGQSRIGVERLERLAAALQCPVAALRAPLEAPVPRMRVRKRDGLRQVQLSPGTPAAGS